MKFKGLFSGRAPSVMMSGTAGKGQKSMDATLDILPGEGEVKTTTRRRDRQECEVCGEPAHYKHTFLFENARRNPASKAYGRDDCSWCEDESKFVCKEHQSDKSAPYDGLSWCATFPASERFAHMFLVWHEIK